MKFYTILYLYVGNLQQSMRHHLFVVALLLLNSQASLFHKEPHCCQLKQLQHIWKKLENGGK
ncbi:UNVERIFIED_CONTAM: hypothetical protein FKN15_066044 [Acipenser sinensis]